MKKSMIILSAVLCLLLAACSDENTNTIDTSSANYQQGYEDGEKAGEAGTIDDLSRNPDKYDMVQKEDVMDYVYDNYDRESLISWYDTKSKSEAFQSSESSIDWNAIKQQDKKLDSEYPSRGEIAGKEERALHSEEATH